MQSSSIIELNDYQEEFPLYKLRMLANLTVLPSSYAEAILQFNGSCVIYLWLVGHREDKFPERD